MHALGVAKPQSSWGSKGSSAAAKDADRQHGALEKQFTLAQQKTSISDHHGPSLVTQAPDANVDPRLCLQAPWMFLPELLSIIHWTAGDLTPIQFPSLFGLVSKPPSNNWWYGQPRRRPLPPWPRGSALGKDYTRRCPVTFRP